MTTLKEKIEVMQAALDGKEIEYLHPADEEWVSITINNDGDIDWNWPVFDYRIKPEPMEFWVNVWSNREPNMCWKSEDDAKNAAHGIVGHIKSVKMKEVIE